MRKAERRKRGVEVGELLLSGIAAVCSVPASAGLSLNACPVLRCFWRNTIQSHLLCLRVIGRA